jgi:predicted metal-dependent phosphotriesterase family hydrolase
MTDYKDKLGGLADKLKKETPKTPIQEVHPVRQNVTAKENEAQLNVWIPKGLLKRLKSYGVEYDQSLKDISIDALKSFLDAKLRKS